MNDRSFSTLNILPHTHNILPRTHNILPRTHNILPRTHNICFRNILLPHTNPHITISLQIYRACAAACCKAPQCEAFQEHPLRGCFYNDKPLPNEGRLSPPLTFSLASPVMLTYTHLYVPSPDDNALPNEDI